MKNNRLTQDIFAKLDFGKVYEYGSGIRIVRNQNMLKAFIDKKLDYETSFSSDGIEEMIGYLNACYSGNLAGIIEPNNKTKNENI